MIIINKKEVTFYNKFKKQIEENNFVSIDLKNYWLLRDLNESFPWDIETQLKLLNKGIVGYFNSSPIFCPDFID